MSYATGTEFYNLPQTVGTDKRDWFDTNTAFANVDADLHSAKQTADNAASDISSLTTRVGTAEGDISSLSTRVGTAEGKISALEGSVTGLGNEIADIKADLRDAICSVVEPDATAHYAHAVDSYFWYNDTLYITTIAIAVGDTIVPNTNCNTTNVTTEIIKALSGGGSEIDDSTTALDKTWSSNKISGEIGVLSQLQTTAKSNIVSAVNEVVSDLNVTTGTTTDQYVNYIKVGKLVIVTFNLRTATGSATPTWTEVATLPINVAEALAAGSSPSGKSPLVRVSGNKAYVMTNNTTNETVSGQVVSYIV